MISCSAFSVYTRLLYNSLGISFSTELACCQLKVGRIHNYQGQQIKFGGGRGAGGWSGFGYRFEQFGSEIWNAFVHSLEQGLELGMSQLFCHYIFVFGTGLK